jgi:hypothetical protein
MQRRPGKDEGRDTVDAIERLRWFLEQTGEFCDYERISGVGDGLLATRPALSVGDLRIILTLPCTEYELRREHQARLQGPSSSQATAAA